MSGKTIIVAKTFVINGDDLILALRRSKTDPRRPLTWDLPGGEVEYGEDPNEGAARETKEEAGIVIDSPTIFATTALKVPEPDIYVVRLFYYSYVENVDVKISYEHDQYKWVTKAEFNNLDIPDVYKEVLIKLPMGRS